MDDLELNVGFGRGVSLRIGPSPIDGAGLFASRAFEAGQEICRIGGPLVRWEPATPADSARFPHWFGVAPGLWIDPDPPFEFLNHSCEPSAALLDRRRLVARRLVLVGEEITIDYSTTEADAHWSMTYTCGSARCRADLGPIQTAFRGSTEEPLAPPAMVRAWRRDGRRRAGRE